MSFPRAKIQRFNEAPSCSPAPGTYDPKLDTKVKGPMLRKDSRQTSEGDLITGTVKSLSASSIPVFRTPQLPRKVFKAGGKSQGRERCESTSSFEDFDQGKDTCSLYQDLSELESLKQRLKDTIDELNKSKELCEFLNTDITGKIHQIEELQRKNEEFSLEIETLQNKLEEAQTKHQMSLTEFETLDRHTLSHLEEIHSLINEFIDKKDVSFKEMIKLRNELDNLASLKQDLEQKVAQKQQMILLLQGELSSAEVELVECRSECERQSASASERAVEVETLKSTIGNLEYKIEETDKHLRDMRDNLMNGSVVRETLEEQLTEKVTEYSNLEENYTKLLSKCECLKEEHSKEIDQIINKCNKRLNSIVQDLKVTSELMHTKTFNMQDLCNEKLLALENKLTSTIVKTQEIWQKEIIHLKEELKNAADQLKDEQFIAREKIQSLMGEIDKRDTESSRRVKEVESEARIITEKLLRAEEELRKIKDVRDELKISDMENKITIVELQDKVDCLTVERDSCNENLSELVKECDMLKSQNKKLIVGNRNLGDTLEALKVRLLESESDVEKMTAHKCALESEKRNLELALESKLQELEEQKINIAKIETDNLLEIEKVREDLLEKLETFKQKALSSSEQFQKFEAGKNKEIQTLSIQLEHFRSKFEELNFYVASMEQENEKQSQQLQNFHEQQEQLEESYSTLAARCEQQTAELQKYSNDLKLAKEKIVFQEQQILDSKCQIEQLTIDVENSEARIFELNEALGVAEETNVEHEREMEALTEKLDHQRDCAKVATQQIASLEATKSYQEHQLQSLTVELERLKEFSHQATDHMLSLVNSNSDKEKEIEILTAEIEDLKYNYKQITEQMDGMKIELDFEKRKLQDSTEEIKLLEGDRFVKEEQLKELSSELEEQKKCVHNYSAQMAILQNQKLEIEEQLKSVKLQEDILKEKNIKSEETIERLMGNMADLENVHLSEKENYQIDNADAKKQISELLNIKSDLELEVQELKTKCDQFQNLVSDEKVVNSELVDKISSMQNILSCKEKDHTILQEKCETLLSQRDALRAHITNTTVESNQQLNEAQNTIAQLNKKIESLEEDNYTLNCKFFEVEGSAADWKRKFYEVEALIGPFREQLLAYSTECKILEEEKGEVQKHMHELSLKYAAALGHQNHKQKIRHLVKLKDENLQLREEIRNLKRTIEKSLKDVPVSSKSAGINPSPQIHKDKVNIPSVNPTPQIHKKKENIPSVNPTPQIHKNEENIPSVNHTPLIHKKKENIPSVSHTPQIHKKKENIPSGSHTPQIHKNKENIPSVSRTPQIHKNKENVPSVNRTPQIHKNKENIPSVNHNPQIHKNKENIPSINHIPQIHKDKENIPSVNHTPQIHKNKENVPSVNHSPVPITPMKSPTGSPNPKPFADRSAHKNVI